MRFVNRIPSCLCADAGVVSITRGQTALVCLKLRKLTALTARALSALHSPALSKVDLRASLFNTDGAVLSLRCDVNGGGMARFFTIWEYPCSLPYRNTPVLYHMIIPRFFIIWEYLCFLSHKNTPDLYHIGIPLFFMI